ncbi:hypothetical protein BST61_g7322 [Cercospora zeina]
MPVPLYTCGLAEDDYDAPFHKLDLELRQKGERELRVSGAEAAEILLRLAREARRDRTPYAIPHECPHVAEEPKGRKGLSWLAKANLTRSRLADLWQGIFMEYEKAQKAGRGSPCGTYFMTTVTEFANDPSHLAQLDAERELCELESHRLSLIAEDKARALTGYVAQTQWAADAGQKLTSRKETKAKTKSSQSGQDLANGLDLLHLEETSAPSLTDYTNSGNTTKAPSTLIRVKHESLVVFQKMYRADTESTQGGTIRWQVFVQAMKDAGFSAEEAAGSAVSFRSSLGGSVCFHRPHPEPVLHPIMLYAMAQRLTKWFGSTSDTFVLREIPMPIESEGEINKMLPSALRGCIVSRTNVFRERACTPAL